MDDLQVAWIVAAILRTNRTDLYREPDCADAETTMVLAEYVRKFIGQTRVHERDRAVLNGVDEEYLRLHKERYG